MNFKFLQGPNLQYSRARASHWVVPCSSVDLVSDVVYVWLEKLRLFVGNCFFLLSDAPWCLCSP